MKSFLRRRNREKRKRLVLLVRILTAYLDRTNRFVLLQQVQRVIRECYHRHRLGDHSLAPLHETIENRLHVLVDDITWARVIVCLELYMARHNRQQDVHSDYPVKQTTLFAGINQAVTREREYTSKGEVGAALLDENGVSLSVNVRAPSYLLNNV
jgi:hypothetical protein